MNTQRLYLIIGALLLTAVVVFLLLPEGNDTHVHEQATDMPPGHPDVNQMQQGEGAEAQPGAGNVRSDFMETFTRLRDKVEAQPASDTSDVLVYARMLLDAHQEKQSVPLFERYHKAAPRNVPVMLDLAAAYAKTKQVDKAEQMTRKVLSVEPNNTTAMYNLGAIYASTDRKAEAKKAWQDLIKRFPDSEDAARAKAFMAEL